MVGFVYMSEITYFAFVIKYRFDYGHGLVCCMYVLSMILRIFPDIIYFQKCIYAFLHVFVQGPRFTSMWQLKICTFIIC